MRPGPATRDAPDVEAAVRWVACMRSGDFGTAWAIADRVLANRDRSTRDAPNLPYHLRWVWDGTSPDGQDVIVRCYHGLGDTLQFARFLPGLRARARRVTLEMQGELLALFAGFPGVDRLAAFDPAAPLPAGGCDIEIMELGHVMRADAASLASHVPYLRVPQSDIDQARRLASGGIGLCWQAGGWDSARSVKLAKMLTACAGSNRKLISLQRGAAACEAGGQFVNPGDNNTSLVRTAALICAASLTVTVDTAVAHLAGALGRPVIVLLKADADWRWPDAGGGPSHWYPTATVLHQMVAGDWELPLRAAQLLIQLADRSDNPSLPVPASPATA